MFPLVIGIFLGLIPLLFLLRMSAHAIPLAVPSSHHVCSKPLDWFKPDERELARHDDPEKTRLLGENMQANGQLQACGATEDGRMIYGHGRLLAAKAVGVATLEVKIFPASLPTTQFKIIRASENLQRKDLTGFQKWILCSELLSENSDWQMRDLAAHLHLDPSMVTRLLSPSKCIEAARQALREGKIGITDCYAISKLPEAGQAGLLAMKLSGASREDIEAAGRKTRTAAASGSVKVSRLRCALPSGIAVQFTGEGLSLEDALEAMKDLTAELKRAIEQGLDSKTVVRVLADKAKKA